MDIGLLWYDDDPRRGLEDKVGRAAARYREKFGRWPNTCYVNPRAVVDIGGPELRLICDSSKPPSTIRVVSAPNILLHHYWLGENNHRPDPRNGACAESPDQPTGWKGPQPAGPEPAPRRHGPS